MEREGSNGTMRNTTPSNQNYSNSSNQYYMPIANIIRIMRRILPAHAKISDDAKETIQECVSEYISVVTSEANERCHREQRKTVTADDLLWAMNKLGFEQYVRPLSLYLQRYRESESGGGSSSSSSTSNGSVGVGSALTRACTPTAAAAATTLVPIQQYYFTGQVPQEGTVFGGCFVDGSPVVVNVNAGQLGQQSSGGHGGVVHEEGTINPYLNYGQYFN